MAKQDRIAPSLFLEIVNEFMSNWPRERAEKKIRVKNFGKVEKYL